MKNEGFRRRYNRKNYFTDVIYSLKGGSYSGTLKDISFGGAFVITNAASPSSKDDVITISIPFTNGQKHVTRRAKVLWKNEKGFAIEFI